MITEDSYLHHITRYIHMNPKNYLEWQYSSLPYFVGSKGAEWLHPDRILELFSDKEDYLTFLKDYEEQREVLDEIKNYLADH